MAEPPFDSARIVTSVDRGRRHFYAAHRKETTMKLKVYAAGPTCAHVLKLAIKIKQVVGTGQYKGMDILMMTTEVFMGYNTIENPLIFDARHPEYYPELREFCKGAGIAAELCIE